MGQTRVQLVFASGSGMLQLVWSDLWLFRLHQLPKAVKES